MPSLWNFLLTPCCGDHQVDLYRYGDLCDYAESLIRGLEAARTITLRSDFSLEDLADDVWAGLWIVGLTDEAAREASDRLEESEAHGSRLLAMARSLESRERSCVTLCSALNRFLSLQPTSIEEDEVSLGTLSALLESAPSSNNTSRHEDMATAIQYRLAKKRNAERALRALGGLAGA